MNDNITLEDGTKGYSAVDTPTKTELASGVDHYAVTAGQLEIGYDMVKIGKMTRPEIDALIAERVPGLEKDPHLVKINDASFDGEFFIRNQCRITRGVARAPAPGMVCRDALYAQIGAAQWITYAIRVRPWKQT